MTIKLIDFNSGEYQKAFELRNNLLRKPLGLDLNNDQLDAEKNSFHFCLFENDEIIACLVGTPIDSTNIKIRQMAVSENHQSKGLGKKLMIFAEKNLVEKGFKNFELNAREHAIPFYEKLGYQSIGDIFSEVTIPHIKMIKKIDH